MKPDEMKVEQISRMLANPFYCLEKIDPIFTCQHKTIVDEETWVRVAVKSIEESGAEQFCRDLLENLKGNYVNSEKGCPDGYKHDWYE